MARRASFAGGELGGEGVEASLGFGVLVEPFLSVGALAAERPDLGDLLDPLLLKFVSDRCGEGLVGGLGLLFGVGEPLASGLGSASLPP